MRAVFLCGVDAAPLQRAQSLLLQSGLGLGLEHVAAEAFRPGLLTERRQQLPERLCVLFHESPQRALCAALRDRAAQPALVAALADAWRDAHDEILRYHNRHAAQCLLFDVDALGQAPDAFVQRLAESLGQGRFERPRAAAEPVAAANATNAIDRVLATALLSDRPDLRVLVDELLAQDCLGPETASPGPSMEAWRQLRELERAHDQMAQAHQALQSRLQSAVAERDAARAELAATSGARAGTEEQLRHERAEGAALLAQLHAVQEELESILRAPPPPPTPVAPAPAPLPDPREQQLGELLEENELLLLQLHHVQEELEARFLSLRELGARAAAEAPLVSFMQHQWLLNQPSELRIDLRHDLFDGSWYEAESDGRWVGPTGSAGLTLPALRPGHYVAQLHIVDTMADDILQAIQLSLDDEPLVLELLAGALPAVVLARFEIGAQARATHTLEIKLPRVVSPRERGIPDDRQLSVRVRSLVVTRLEEG